MNFYKDEKYPWTLVLFLIIFLIVAVYLVSKFGVLTVIPIAILSFGLIVYNSKLSLLFYNFLSTTSKNLTPDEVKILETKFRFYNRLPDFQKATFRYRVKHFLNIVIFESKATMTITLEMKVLVAASSTMLTFGMKKYIYRSLKRVIIFPDAYFSNVSKAYHLGEFNPNIHALVFSWKHFEMGYETNNDNYNLALHEFTHLLHFECFRYYDSDSREFIVNYNKLKRTIAKTDKLEKLKSKNYLREYAYTDEYEFIAVIIEHFFETPDKLRLNFPRIYEHVSEMLQYKFLVKYK